MTGGSASARGIHKNRSLPASRRTYAPRTTRRTQLIPRRTAWYSVQEGAQARMAKLADAADLKSADPKGLWGFNSPSGHQKTQSPAPPPLHRKPSGRPKHKNVFPLQGNHCGNTMRLQRPRTQVRGAAQWTHRTSVSDENRAPQLGGDGVTYRYSRVIKGQHTVT